MNRRVVRAALLGSAILLAINIAAAFMAGNWIPATRAGEHNQPIGPNDVKPAECAALTLDNTVSGSGIVAGTLGNDLILGSSAADTIDGLAGDDCIVAGAGDDAITGGPGTDVCRGDDGNDTFVGCETEIQ